MEKERKKQEGVEQRENEEKQGYVEDEDDWESMGYSEDEDEEVEKIKEDEDD